ncbi:MAG TPA: glycoside hydrolase, partial [Bryobacteraceae bacterium]
PGMQARTVSEALTVAAPEPLAHIFPGSWIDAKFDIWIGAEEDNQAWEQLLAARRVFDRALQTSAAGIGEEAKRLAREELLIAEGSDWCWWYGPEHSSANRAEFDQLFRGHLANVYRLLGLDPPPELGLPIVRDTQPKLHHAPGGLIQPQIDGTVSSSAEWSQAGRYRIANESGQQSIVREMFYGSSGDSIYFRVDLAEDPVVTTPLEFRFEIRNRAGERFAIHLLADGQGVALESVDMPEGAVEAALGQIFEMRLSMSALHLRPGDPLHLRLSVLRAGLTIASLPLFGEVELYARPLAAHVF